MAKYRPTRCTICQKPATPTRIISKRGKCDKCALARQQAATNILRAAGDQINELGRNLAPGGRVPKRTRSA